MRMCMCISNKCMCMHACACACASSAAPAHLLRFWSEVRRCHPTTCTCTQAPASSRLRSNMQAFATLPRAADEFMCCSVCCGCRPACNNGLLIRMRNRGQLTVLMPASHGQVVLPCGQHHERYGAECSQYKKQMGCPDCAEPASAAACAADGPFRGRLGVSAAVATIGAASVDRYDRERLIEVPIIALMDFQCHRVRALR